MLPFSTASCHSPVPWCRLVFGLVLACFIGTSPAAAQSTIDDYFADSDLLMRAETGASLDLTAVLNDADLRLQVGETMRTQRLTVVR